MPRDDAKDSCNGFAIRNERFDELRFHSFNCSDSLRFVCEKQNQKAFEKSTTSRVQQKSLTLPNSHQRQLCYRQQAATLRKKEEELQ